MKNISKMFTVIALSAVIVFSMTACGDDPPKEIVINIPGIPGITAPVTGATPVTSIDPTTQYTGTVAWSPAISGGSFAGEEEYTATITLTPTAGYTLQGVAADSFTVAGGVAVNAANSGVVEVKFPVTEPVSFDVFYNESLIDTIELSSALLAGVEEVILTSTGGRELLAYLLTDILEAAGTPISAFSDVEAEDADGANILDDFDIRKAYLVVARNDVAETYNPPRIIGDGTVEFANGAIRSGFVSLVFTPGAWEIPDDYEFGVDVFDDADLLGVIEVDALKYLKQIKWSTSSDTGREYPGYMLTEVLESAGISIPINSTATATSADLSESTPISDITNAAMVLARIDTGNETILDYPRIIADATEEITNATVRKGFDRLVFAQ